MRMPKACLTQEIEQVIRTLVADARSTRDFDDLPIPFRAMATDMLTGEMVILDGGDLATAMRASMAVPGAFSPVALDGRVLSDGGMMRNLPVESRATCAPTSSSRCGCRRRNPKPPIGIGAGAPVALDGRDDPRQRARADREPAPDDVGIEVAMGDIGSADFDVCLTPSSSGGWRPQRSARR